MVAEIVDIAEHVSYLELTSRICYYNEPNLNGDMLPYDDSSLGRAQTLVNMPVQAKYRANADGTPSLGGHELVKKKNGTIEFKTQSIGTHTSVEIKDDNVLVNGEVKTLPCLFATYRIWKRYPNIINAVKRLYENNILYGSWEINTYQYLYDNGIKKITDYEFIANCLLGETSYPSYGTCAKAISMAQYEDNQLMIAEALSQDLLNENIINEEENQLANNKVNTDETTIATEDTQPENTVPVSENENTTDTAQLTSGDLRSRLSTACREKLKQWCWVSFLFPNEKELWCEYDGATSELDYVKFTYDVGEDDSIALSEPEYVKLTVSVAEINSKIAELEKEVETVKAELDLKNSAITKASEDIQSLNNTIAELTPYKEQVEIAEREKIEKQIASEKEELRNKLVKSDLFTETEIAEKDIQDLIEARNVSAINGLIADKFLASFDIKDKETTEMKQETVIASANLESVETETDIRSFMNKILFN